MKEDPAAPWESSAAGRPRASIGRALAILGPGLVAGAADDDPAGLITALQAGAQFRYALAWTALIQFPLLAALQIMVARIGLVTGRDFTRVLGEHYPRSLLWGSCVLLLAANTVTAGADLGGVAASVHLLTGAPITWTAVMLTIVLPIALVFGSYHLIARVLKWLTVALFAYVVAGLLAAPRWSDVLRQTAFPGASLTRDYLSLFVALFGGTISPYLLVWQSAEEVEELSDAHKPALRRRPWAARRELRQMRQDTIFGMGVSQLITYFTIIAAGAVIFPTGLREIDTARQAAMALRPIGGGIGEILFALGMIGTGLLAIPTLTGASAYAIAAAAKWPAGINKPARQTKGFNIVLTLGVLSAGIIAVATGNPMRLLVASQVLNGILAPPLLVLVLMLANNKKILGCQTNGRWLNAFGIATLLVMGIPSAWLIGSWVVKRFSF